MIYHLLFATGCLLALDSAILLSISNGHLGTILPAIMGGPLIAIWILRGHMAAWLQTPWGNAIRWALICGYAAVAVFFAITAAMLRHAASERAEYNRDVLIVLGCAVRGDKVSLALRYRLDTALEYLSHSPDTSVIVAGGLGDGENVSEASAMKAYLVERGIAPGRIIMEDQSGSTWENFKFTKPILDERFPNASVAFVTTAFHVYRSERVARMHGIEAVPYAAPDVWYFAPNNYLREGFAVALYKLRGQLI